MKIKIAHLLHYYWQGPGVGFRIAHKGRCIGTVCRIPQWLSSVLLNLSNRFGRNTITI